MNKSNGVAGQSGCIRNDRGFVHANRWLVLLLCLTAPMRVFGAFGVTSSGGNYVVDTGAGLVFQINQSNGDMNSIVFNGVQYQATDKNSQIASGLGTLTTVTATNINNQYIVVTSQTATNNAVVNSLTHYLIATNGLNTIFMGTYATAEPAVGELRWITRLQYSKLSHGPAPSDNNGNTGAIESTDVNGMADGTTRSKYYGDGVSHGKDRAMDLTYCGATGTSVGVWMVFDNPRESDAGGPFFRDIENQAGTDQEVYNYMNSGHNQTESYRVNVLYGPYALVFNNGVTPSFPLDYSWIATAGISNQITGYVGKAARGAVTGTVSGIPAGFQAVVGFANTTAQYWSVASNGTYTTPLMKTGTYTVTLYKGELGVASSSVTVSAGVTNTLNLISTETNPLYVFRIGQWDGTPNGFLNSTNVFTFSKPNNITMHPQDVRNASWGPVTFTAGTDPDSKFPAIQFRGTNSPTTILFNLTSAQISNMTLRIGATCAYNSGRPDIHINGVDRSYPSASSQPSSRSFTIGTYRGNNVLWTWNILSSTLVVGQNTLTISPVSGSSDLSPWLSAGWAYDAVELDGPPAPTPPAAPTNLTATAGNAQVALNWAASSGATGYNVKDSTVSGGAYALIASNVASTVYTDTTVVAGTTYYYVVSAVNAGGESTNSTEAGVYVLSLLEQWQMNYFGCTNCPQAAPDADPLGKGFSNTNQFLLGLDPTNPASVFRVLSAVLQTTDVVITWAAGAGRTNVVQATAGDVDGGYTNAFGDISGLVVLPGSGDVTTNYVDSGGATNVPSRYYRIRLGP